MTDRDIDRAMLARYVAGECSAEETARIAAWLDTSAPGRAVVADLEAVWRSTADVTRPRAGNAAAAWTALMGRIEAGRGARALRIEPRRAAVPLRRWRSAPATVFLEGVAAAVVVAVGAALIWRSASVAGARSGQEYATANGERETVTLSDGTQLALAPATRVRLGGTFASGRRDVYLVDGEAMFTVVHDTRRPFVVHTRNAVTTDVGTVFAVRSYDGDSTVRVVVRVGVVALGDSTYGRTGSVLGAGALGVVDQAGRVSVASGVDIDRYLAWTRGELVFRGTPLRAVLAEVGRWYDLDIRLTDASLSDRPVTGSFDSEPTDDVLGSIAATLGTVYTRAGRLVVFGARATHRAAGGR